jgi:hypothetical protein
MRSTNHNETLTLPVLVSSGEPVLLKAGGQPSADWITYNRKGRVLRLPVRQYRVSEMTRYLQRGLDARSDFQRRLHLAANLYGMVERRRHIADIGRLLLKHFPKREDRKLLMQAMAKPLEEVAALLSIGMHGLMPVVWQSHDGSRMALGLFAPREDQAAFALATFRLLGRFGWAACKRKTCGNVFFPQRKRHEYCSHNCEMAEVMRRRRARAKRQGEQGPKKKTVATDTRKRRSK